MNNPKPALQGEGAQAPSSSDGAWEAYCDACARARYEMEWRKSREDRISNGLPANSDRAVSRGNE